MRAMPRRCCSSTSRCCCDAATNTSSCTRCSWSRTCASSPGQPGTLVLGPFRQELQRALVGRCRGFEVACHELVIRDHIPTQRQIRVARNRLGGERDGAPVAAGPQALEELRSVVEARSALVDPPHRFDHRSRRLGLIERRRREHHRWEQSAGIGIPRDHGLQQRERALVVLHLEQLPGSARRRVDGRRLGIRWPRRRGRSPFDAVLLEPRPGELEHRFGRLRRRCAARDRGVSGLGPIVLLAEQPGEEPARAPAQHESLGARRPFPRRRLRPRVVGSDQHADDRRMAALEPRIQPRDHVARVLAGDPGVVDCEIESMALAQHLPELRGIAVLRIAGADAVGERIADAQDAAARGRYRVGRVHDADRDGQRLQHQFEQQQRRCCGDREPAQGRHGCGPWRAHDIAREKPRTDGRAGLPPE